MIKKELSFFPIYLLLYQFIITVWPHRFLFYSMIYNPQHLLFILRLNMYHIWPMETKPASVSFWHNPFKFFWELPCFVAQQIMCCAILEPSRFLNDAQLQFSLSYIRKSNLTIFPTWNSTINNYQEIDVTLNKTVSIFHILIHYTLLWMALTIDVSCIPEIKYNKDKQAITWVQGRYDVWHFT